MLSSKKLLLMKLGAAQIKPQDVYASTAYTGTGSTQAILLPFTPDLVWAKRRNNTNGHNLFDSLRGGTQRLAPNYTAMEEGVGLAYFTPTATGYTAAGADGGWNSSGDPFISWAFRFLPSFCVAFTYTGNGQPGRQLPHPLGQRPGMVVIKRLDAPSDWFVSHIAAEAASGGNPARLLLNSTVAAVYDSPTDYAGWAGGSNASVLTVGSLVNVSGARYVAYLFAHNPDLIDCGSYAGTGNTPGPNVICGNGWTPQLIIAKCTTADGGWLMLDAARGMGLGADKQLYANTSQAENIYDDFVDLTATGFRPRYLMNSASNSFSYLAIRSPT